MTAKETNLSGFCISQEDEKKINWELNYKSISKLKKIELSLHRELELIFCIDDKVDIFIYNTVDKNRFFLTTIEYVSQLKALYYDLTGKELKL